MNEHPVLEDLLQRIERRSATVGIIGMGYVGLPLALVFHEAGFPVVGFDVDPSKIDALHRGESYIRHIGPDRVAAAFGVGTTPSPGPAIRGTTDFNRLAECDAVLVCVPTPLGEHRDPDLTYVVGTAETIAKHLRKGQLVILESTTYPGTTREELLPRFEARTDAGGAPLRCGADFFLAFSPEREDPGNRHFNTRTIPKVVGGIDTASGRAATALYGAAIDTIVPVSSAEVAESSKLLENIFRAINIALVNELKMVFDRMGINVWEVIEAAKTKPFGFMPFYPGPGLGGHCIPLDPFYLSWKASESGAWARFIELAGEINSFMPRWVVQKVQEALNDDAKAIRGSRILVLGLSYKADIDDDRESPSFEIIEILREKGAVVDYCDPHIAKARKGRKHDLDLASVPCDAATFASYDAVLLLTAHEQFRNPSLYRDVRLLVDTRNAVPASALAGGRLVGA
jgi:UDP-N-acetyl-D-glucosamine dehydrogenase